MSDDIYEQNVYSLKEPMWHGKGTVGQDGEHAETVYERMTPVQFESRPFSINLGGKIVESGDFGIVRTSGDEEVLVGTTKGRYRLTQPVEYCRMFDANVRKEVETLGFLGVKADKMFLTWKLPKIDVYGDEVDAYGFLNVGFDGKYGEHLHVTKVRVVCQNTWNAALSGTDGGKSQMFNGKHNHTNHERDLGLWMEFIEQDAQNHVALHQSLFRKMEETKVSENIATNLFSNVYPLSTDRPIFGPPIILKERNEKSDEEDEKAVRSRNLAMDLFMGQGIEINRTLWGTFNCVTEIENHHRSSKKDDTLSVLLGARHKVMERAMLVSTNYLKSQE
jgi:hypothetical protein